MSRKPRKLTDSGVYHVIIRGNDQQDIFYDNSDRYFFINRISKYANETNVKIYAYCLMNNHVHFLLGNGNENQNMARFIKKISCSYVYRFNHKYERTGHLFQGRYKSEPIETVEYFKTVYRYIIKNPEKAGICDYKDYKWSSLFCNESNIASNKSYIDSVFGSAKEKFKFLNKNDDQIYMENIENFKKQNDDELKVLFIKQLFSIENVLLLNKEPINLRKQKMSILKQCGLSINQIARITGINRYFIRTA